MKDQERLEVKILVDAPLLPGQSEAQLCRA